MQHDQVRGCSHCGTTPQAAPPTPLPAELDNPGSSSSVWDGLPQDVWLAIIQHMATEERAALAPCVCKAWRELALTTCSELDVCLGSGKAAVAFGVWLKAHGHLLQRLAITDTFYIHTAKGRDRRAAPHHRIALLQGLHGGGRVLPLLAELRLELDELTAADAVCLGLANAPALTRLHLNSNGSNIGVTGAQGLAPLVQLRQLLVPTQALGDQGLQIICRSLTNLEHINLHNDGHVTDDGLRYLAGLSRLTSLDLQGSISISDRGIPSLAAALPQLVQLNLSWCSGVDDWGLQQLCSLSCLASLNLESTHVTLEAVPGLTKLAASLTQLNLGHTNVGAAGLATLAASLTNLRELWLNHNSLSSMKHLRTLKPLSSLTRLDVSRPVRHHHPDHHLAAVFELTQLVQLVAVSLLPSDLLQHVAGRGVYPPLPLPQDCADRAAAASDGVTLFAGGSSDGRGGSSTMSETPAADAGSGASAGASVSAGAAAGAGSAVAGAGAGVRAAAGSAISIGMSTWPQQQQEEEDGEGDPEPEFWWHMMEQLSCMRHLRSLDFRQSTRTSDHGVLVALLVVCGVASVAPQPVIRELRVSVTRKGATHRVTQMLASLTQQGGSRPEQAGMTFEQCMLCALSDAVLDSIDMQQLGQFCAEHVACEAAGSSSCEQQEEQQQEEQQEQPQEQARNVRRLAALHAKVSSLLAERRAFNKDAPAAAAAAADVKHEEEQDSAASALAAGPRAPLPPRNVYDAKALLKLMLPALQRLQLSVYSDQQQDAWQGNGIYQWTE